jgi:hypothetical protein
MYLAFRSPPYQDRFQKVLHLPACRPLATMPAHEVAPESLPGTD